MISIMGWIFERVEMRLGDKEVRDISRDGDGMWFRLGAMTGSGREVRGCAGEQVGI